MALSKKDLKELTKGCQYDLEMVTEVYEVLLENHTDGDPSVLTSAIVAEHLLWMTNNDIKDIDTYKQMIEDFKTQTDEIASLDSNKVSYEEMRKKLGYNNAEWKKIKELDATMVREIKKLIVEFMSVSVVEGFSIEQVEENPIFKKLDIIWRNFMRNYVIPNYPRAKNDKVMRTKLTGLFKTKLVEALKTS